MKHLLALVVTTGILLTAISHAQAASITTTFANNNSFDGNMFDLTTFNNALTVNSLAINLAAGTASEIRVYTRNGTYTGFESNAAAWTLVSQSFNILSAGTDNPTFVDVMDFSLLANSVTGIYITTTGQDNGNPFMLYTNGSNTFANADLQLNLGVGKEALFGRTFSPRTWNGTINYTVQNSGTPGAVPEPGTIFLMSTGLTGLAVWRMRKGKEVTEK
ncbi:MAG: PEP-CTERM sorting domain-containing protein [Nitrospirales bacterium]|nr:PEP-CTERM sorting domain-containing protein [Nitrospira sp.]MDR4502849.1 PEP-CTERM sorting domain-containing protein [Nitrospirales bacterium]